MENYRRVDLDFFFSKVHTTPEKKINKENYRLAGDTSWTLISYLFLSFNFLLNKQIKLKKNQLFLNIFLNKKYYKKQKLNNRTIKLQKLVSYHNHCMENAKQ
jgi:hypothetical protein